MFDRQKVALKHNFEICESCSTTFQSAWPLSQIPFCLSSKNDEPANRFLNPVCSQLSSQSVVSLETPLSSQTRCPRRGQRRRGPRRNRRVHVQRWRREISKRFLLQHHTRASLICKCSSPEHNAHRTLNPNTLF